MVNQKLKNSNQTPLHEAVKRSNLDIVRLLVDAHAKVGELDDNDYTPLMVAVIANQVDIVRYLLTLKSVIYFIDSVDKVTNIY
jgi:ankyrin repeat protein